MKELCEMQKQEQENTVSWIKDYEVEADVNGGLHRCLCPIWGLLVELWAEEEPAEVETGKMDQKGGNLLTCKLAPIQEGQEKIKVRGRLFQIGR